MVSFKQGISFIIPAKNEEKGIGITLDAIRAYAGEIEHEVIVINHNSSDATKSVAESKGAKVYDLVGGTIGSARNFGTQKASFSILVFLDADVSLTSKWQHEIGGVIEKIRNDSLYLTGSHCVPPEDGSYLEKHWFANFSQDVKTTHLGTGHMIMARSLFDRIGGFSETLKTGEDYDICQRAKLIGAVVENSPNLLVIHRDYPQNIVDFFRRERWHGRGDAQSVKIFFASKVAVGALLHVLFHVIFMFALWSGLDYTLLLLSLASLFAVPFLAVIYKFKGLKAHIFIINVLIFYVYFWARFFSIL